MSRANRFTLVCETLQQQYLDAAEHCKDLEARHPQAVQERQARMLEQSQLIFEGAVLSAIPDGFAAPIAQWSAEAQQLHRACEKRDRLLRQARDYAREP